MTEFAVATAKQARGLRGIKESGRINGFETGYARTHAWSKGWWKYASSETAALTDAGELALELRETLGPDRNLTKAQARALREQITPARHVRALLKLGLLDEGDALTEEGARIVAILDKYRAEVAK